ncbi:MAG: phosphatase PAP2 family protein, partial [Aliifodinibius sp.]|nr:phosphatase PAP2 family protein [Fodinibius sp.]
WIPAIWGGAVGIPTTVGLLRIISGWHFPTDVLVGALVGTLIGYVILSLHDKNNRKNNHPEQFRLGLNIYLQP